MKIHKLKDICIDIFAGAAIFTNDKLSRDSKDGGYRVIRLSDIQNNEIFFKDCLFYNKIDYKKNRYLLQDNDILLSSRGTIFKVAVFHKEDSHKTIPSGFLTCIRLNPELNISVHYIAAYLRYKKHTILNSTSNATKLLNRKPKIQLNLVNIYNVEIPILPYDIQKKIDKLSLDAAKLLKQNIKKTIEIEKILSNL